MDGDRHSIPAASGRHAIAAVAGAASRGSRRLTGLPHRCRGSNNAAGVSDRATITAGTTLQPGCHYLITNSSASGGPYSGAVPGDQTFTTGITDDGGIAVTLPDNTIVDAVGMSTGSAFKEGTVLASLGSSVLSGNVQT